LRSVFFFILLIFFNSFSFACPRGKPIFFELFQSVFSDFFAGLGKAKFGWFGAGHRPGASGFPFAFDN